MRTLHPKNYTIIETTNGKYLVRTKEYLERTEYSVYYEFEGLQYGKCWRKCKGSLYINSTYIVAVKSR